jgi:hypothetical protein
MSISPALLLGVALVTAPLELTAQTSATHLKGAASITANDVARRIGVIAHDSMLGRDTPSRGLELTARYVADQFRAFGLRPGGDRGSWLQRYSITKRRLDLNRSVVVFATKSAVDSAPFTASARYDGGPIAEEPVSGAAVVVAGPHTAESAGQLAVADKMALYLPSPGADPEVVQQVLRALYLAGPRALVLVSSADSGDFAAGIPARSTERTVVGPLVGRPAVLQVHGGAVQRSLAAVDVDLHQVRESTQPFARELSQLTVTVNLRDTVTWSASAPNTVGILEGTDPRLKDEYLVFSAHMDHIGVTPGRPDSINNGADDDASGTVGVIELAEAFSRPGARPKRSVIFLTVSGEEKGLWGSNYFVSHPPVPISQVVAGINLDMIGRNWPDTIVAIGKEHSDLGTTLERVNAAHPELGMTAIDDQWPDEQFYIRSDHYNFARRGVPILFFFNGVHKDYHAVTDSPDKINSEKEARILKLLFYLGHEIGNAAQRPKWKPESYRDIVE